MTKQYIRTVVAVAVLITTVVVFALYFTHHPETIRSLAATSPLTLLTLILLYAVFTGTLVWIQRAILDICELSLSRKENALLIMYSSIINFFGPLQSGPGFRAAYLKKRHKVSLKRYTLATLVYYGLYAAFSGMFILAYAVKAWIILLVIAAFIISPLMLRIRKFRELRLLPVLSLALATLAQVSVQAVIYFVELHSFLSHIGYVQALIYTGAANFALFVSLTPGAIGFRESFLLFSQKLHHIGNSTIAAASVIDRSAYIILLLIMAVCIFGFHANRYFKNGKNDTK